MEDGGLGLTNVAVKADSLLVKQMCRMLIMPDEDSYRLMGYWMGNFLSETGWGVNFPELAAIGPVSHIMSKKTPLHSYMCDTFVESLGRGEVVKVKLKSVTTKEIYKSRMKDLFTPPKIEEKFPLTDFKDLVYPRMRHPILDSKQKDILFCIVHDIYLNKERLFQQQRVGDPLCSYQACVRESLVQSVEHIFCNCYRVRGAWQWTRGKLLELLAGPAPPPVVTNIDFLKAMFPKGLKEVECLFLLGNYLEMVDRDVGASGKELFVGAVRGQLFARVEAMKGKAVPTINHFVI